MLFVDLQGEHQLLAFARQLGINTQDYSAKESRATYSPIRRGATPHEKAAPRLKEGAL